jgi:hypothetical protein
MTGGGDAVTQKGDIVEFVPGPHNHWVYDDVLRGQPLLVDNVSDSYTYCYPIDPGLIQQATKIDRRGYFVFQHNRGKSYEGGDV